MHFFVAVVLLLMHKLSNIFSGIRHPPPPPVIGGIARLTLAAYSRLTRRSMG